MEKQSSFRARTMEKQQSIRSVTFEKQPSIRRVMEKQQSFNGESTDKPPSALGPMEKQQSFHGVTIDKQPSTRGVMEKQKSFRGFIEKQKSFRVVMERQLSFIGGGERKKNKDSPGKRGDLQLHLAARAGNLSRVMEILQSCDANEAKDLLSKKNQEGETPLYVAAESGHALIVEEMLQHMDLETASIPARNGYDSFHVAAKQGHLEVLKELLGEFPNLVMTTDLSCSTALHTAAAQGHIDVVNFLLEIDSNLAKIARNNGKTVLHSAARMGHLEVVKALVSKDPSTGFRTDKKGQTALHMAVKGQNEDIVLELIKPDPSVLKLEDNKGNTALHIAIKKGRTQVWKRHLYYEIELNGGIALKLKILVGISMSIVRCLLSIEGIDVNSLNKAGESPLDIAEKLGNTELFSLLKEAGAAHSKDHGKPPSATKQLKQTVSDIKHDVQSQLQQSRQTGFKVHKIAKKLKKLHISGLNNAINSSTVVAVLIATVAFAAIFTVPGQYVEEKTEGFSLGQAHIAKNAAFIIFFVFDSLALFISLAVVVVQTSVVVIEEKAKRQLVFVINKLMWLACLFISIAFISLTYVVVGEHSRWLAVSATVIGGTIMLTTIGSMCYCVILHRMEAKKLRNIRKAESRSRSFSMSVASDQEILNSEYKRMYAL
ncbi:ANK REP REGION domain-containing protein [Citrus sinensis]|nr:ANK REP REGION domain-containing protein [Citrus sinensis]